MIFNTFKSDIGGFKNSFGLFGASFQQIKQYGIGSAFGKLDKNVLLQYNEAIKAGCGHTQAYNIALTDLDGNLINVNNATKKAMITANGQVIALEKINSGARASAIGMSLLNAAMNFGIMMAVTGLIELGKYLWKLVPTTEHLKEQLEETAQALADIKTESKSIKDELTTIRDRIAELESKGALSFTDETELTRLKQENAQLERKLVLLDEERKRKSKEQQGTFKKTVASDYFTYGEIASRYQTTSHHDGSSSATMISEKDYIDEQFRYLKEQEAKLKTATKKERDKIEKEIEKTEKYLSKEISTSQSYLDALEEAGYIYGTDAEVDKYIDWIYEFQDKYLVAVGNTSELFNSAYNREKYSEARTAIEELGTVTSESLQELYNTNPQVKEFVDYLFSLGTTDAKSVTDFLSLLPGEFKKIEESVKDAETSFKSIAKTLSDGLDKLSNKKDILSEVKEELDSFGAISADNISKILEQFSDNDDVQKAVAYYLSGIGTAQQLYDAMAKGYQNDLKLQAQTLATQMQNDENYFKSLAKLHGDFANFQVGNYKIDLSNATSLADAKLRIENDLIGTLKTNWQKYYNAQGASIEELVARARALMLNTSRGRETYAGEHAEATRRYNEIYAVYKQYKDASAALDQLTLKGFTSTGFNASLSTDFEASSGKTAAEKYFDKQKYLLETNQITQEEYLKRINKKYKEFYKNQGDDLEDYAKYSQEVYDGFKDMYKDDLEAQKEAWEEKKDAVSEYYDNLREQIEDAHDEEDYEKEQTEKRKEIFDLDMKIAELMRDGSEKAKARIAELEEERLKAEEELLDFETDKAREDELSRLEKEQESEEAKIQKKIDGIQGQLDQLDKDTVSVRNAIIAYAKEKGVTLSFAYASGTRSSVGGLGRINEKGIEMIAAPDGNGNYINLMPNSYVFSAKATEFLWKLATEHSLPQAMYNSIAKSIQTQSGAPSVNIAQPISITMGNVIIQGNADKQTVADIKKQQENTVRMVLQKIKELQK